jgi:Flp pilus assembly protein TadG
VKRIKREKGQSAVEFALILPILLLIVCGIIDFGWLFYNQLGLNNTCREGARFAVVNASEDNSNTLIVNRIKDVTPESLKDDLEINIIYSEPLDPLTGDVTIVLTSEMSVLTPVLGVFNPGQTKTLTASVTMKVES